MRSSGVDLCLAYVLAMSLMCFENFSSESMVTSRSRIESTRATGESDKENVGVRLSLTTR